MTDFSAVIAGLQQTAEGFTAHVPANWQQGRTTYGGMSAALCVEAATRSVVGLPPLRAAQFTFIGPAGGDVRITVAVLRQGKNSVFIGADMYGEQGLATRATLTFAAGRQSALNYTDCPMPSVPAPAACGPFFDRDVAPAFTQHFDARHAGGAKMATNASKPEMLVWARHHDAAAWHSVTGLIALGDALPPAAFTMFPRPAPISTITWSIEIVGDAARETVAGAAGETVAGAAGETVAGAAGETVAGAAGGDGWHLLRSLGETVADGYCSQDMKLWAADGTPVMLSRQLVAVFV